MSETDALSPQELKLRVDGNSVDWFLQDLVATVNSGLFEVGVTLFVEGLIVSGRLVSGKRYFAAIGQQFYDGCPGNEETKQMMRDAFEGKGEIYDRKDDADVPPPQFIHLIDALCFGHSGAPIPNDGPVVWRGRINAVSGFYIGQHQLAED